MSTPVRFGPYGGRYVPETVIPALDELTAAYERLQGDPGFHAELAELLKNFVGRPTPLYLAERLGARLGGLRVYLKREDLAHTGAHKINNTVGQLLLAVEMGKRRIIAETGAGQHGVATATAAALFGLPCAIYMGEKDIARQELNVVRMKLLGAEVIPVASGSRTLKDAVCGRQLRNQLHHPDAVLVAIAVNFRRQPLSHHFFAWNQLIHLPNNCLGGLR